MFSFLKKIFLLAFKPFEKSIKGLLGIPHQPIYKNQNELDNNDKDFSEKSLSNEIHVRFKESSLFLQDKEKYSELIIKFVDDLNKIKNNNKKLFLSTSDCSNLYNSPLKSISYVFLNPPSCKLKSLLFFNNS